MKCYYEVLNVSREADDAEIKSAYKKLALRWHPDKNLHDADIAKEQFQLVQQAYDVLSDRQERAWYDKHREQILHQSSKEDFEDNCLNVFQYFTTSCYSGYEDDEQGFYCVYRRVFEAIAKEDMEYMSNKEEFTSIPMFGGMDSDYETVVRSFYNFWMSYTTKRSYVWLDPYQLINQRRVAKIIEKENKKIRMRAKKERNEEVRNLVAFVRKRDKRVLANVRLLEQKAKDNQKKAEEMARHARRELRAETNRTVQGEWSKFDNLKDELEIIEQQLAQEFSDNENAASDDEDLYCVACNKVFKTSKAFANHESSKKHRENVERLRDEMLDEDAISEEEIDEPLVQPKKKSKSKKNKTLKVDFAGTENDHERDNELHPVEKSLANSKEINKKTKRRKSKSTNCNDNDKSSIKADIDVNHTCITCQSVFPSKNKLFEHLKAENHGVYIEKTKKNSTSKKGTKI